MRPIPGTITDPAMTRRLDGESPRPEYVVTLTPDEVRTVLLALTHVAGVPTRAERNVLARIAAALASQS